MRSPKSKAAPKPPPAWKGSPPRSYICRFSGSLSTSYAAVTSLKRSWLPGSWFTSGWSSRASLR